MVVIVKLNSAFSHLDKKNGSKTIPFKQVKAFTLSKIQAWIYYTEIVQYTDRRQD